MKNQKINKNQEKSTTANQKIIDSHSQVSTMQILSDYMSDTNNDIQRLNQSNFTYQSELSFISNQTEKYNTMISQSIETINQKLSKIIYYLFFKRVKNEFIITKQKQINKKSEQGKIINPLKVLVKMNLTLSVKINKIIDNSFFNIKIFARNNIKHKINSINQQPFLRLFQTYQLLEIKTINKYHIHQSFQKIKESSINRQKNQSFLLKLNFILFQNQSFLPKKSDFFMKLKQIEQTKDKIEILLYTIGYHFKKITKLSFQNIVQYKKQVQTSFFKQVSDELIKQQIQDIAPEKIFDLKKLNNFFSDNVLCNERQNQIMKNTKSSRETQFNYKKIDKQVEYYGNNNRSRNFQIIRTVQERQYSVKSIKSQSNSSQDLHFNFKIARKKLTNPIRSSRQTQRQLRSNSNIQLKERSALNNHNKNTLYYSNHDKNNLCTSNHKIKNNDCTDFILENTIINSQMIESKVFKPAKTMQFYNFYFKKGIKIQINTQEKLLKQTYKLKPQNQNLKQKPLKLYYLQSDTLRIDVGDIGQKLSQKLIDSNQLNRHCKKQHTKTSSIQSQKYCQPLYEIYAKSINLQMPKYISLDRIRSSPSSKDYNQYKNSPIQTNSKPKRNQNFRQYLERRKQQGLLRNYTPQKRIRTERIQKEVVGNEKQQIHKAYYPGFSKNYYPSQYSSQKNIHRKQLRSKSPLIKNNNFRMQNNTNNVKCQFEPKYQRKKYASPKVSLNYHQQYQQINQQNLYKTSLKRFN